MVLAVDGRKLTRESDLADLISARDAGDEVELEVYRDGDRRNVKVEARGASRALCPSGAERACATSSATSRSRCASRCCRRWAPTPPGPTTPRPRAAT